MTTALYSHESSKAHITPEGHPERVARLAAVEAALAELELLRKEASLGAKEDVLLCHPESYFSMLETVSPGQLDEDTHVSAGSFNAAMHAVGGAVAAVDCVMSSTAGNAFVAMRPPGHHAETAKPMGFCLFGTVAIAAKHLIERRGLSRVAVIDFDVHHGNGTQDLLWNEPRALFVTSQQMPLWPGTGDVSETGAHGQIVNIPLAPESDGAVMRAAYERDALPALEAFAPEFVLVSAGFDAHARDPLAQLNWQEDDYIWLTEKLCDLADKHAGGKLVSVLEGGYDLDALAASVQAHVEVLIKRAR